MSIFNKNKWSPLSENPLALYDADHIGILGDYDTTELVPLAIYDVDYVNLLGDVTAPPTPLVVWDADLGVNLSGSDVTSWEDQGTSGDPNRDAIGTAGSRPTYTLNDSDFNGHGSISFTGNQALYSAYVNPVAATYYFVGKTATSASNFRVVFDSSGRQLTIANYGLWRILNGGSFNSTTTAPLNSNVIVALSYDTVPANFYVDSSVLNATANSGYTPTGGLKLGNLDGIYSWEGKFAYFAIYPGVHTDEQRSLIMKSLSIKYGIAVSIPAYKLLDQGPSGDSNRIAIQNTLANMPLHLSSDPDFNGHGSLKFDGTSDYLRTGTWSSATSQPCTYYYVAKLGNSATDIISDGLTTNRHAIYFNSGVPSLYSSGTVTGSTDFRSTQVVGCATFNTTSSTIHMNKTSVLEGSGNVGTTTCTGLTIGAVVDLAFYGTNKLAYLVVYSGAHNEVTRAKIMKDLSVKYSISITVPSNQVVALLDCGYSEDSNRVPVSTDGYRPTRTASDSDFNGHGSIQFAIDKFLTTGNWNTNIATPCTYYYVAKWGNNANTYSFLVDGKNTSQSIFQYTNGFTYDYTGTGINIYEGVNRLSQKVIGCHIFNTTASSVYSNSSLSAGASGAVDLASPVPNGLLLGKSFTGGFVCNAKLAFMAVYAGVHDQTTRTRVMEYLEAKYNIGVDRPIVEYEPNAAGVRLYSGDNTKVDRLWNRAQDPDSTKIAIQDTSANMPTWIESDGYFNNHPSLSFSGNQWLKTGTFPKTITQPVTYYVVGKKRTTASPEFIFDGINSNRQAIYIDINNVRVYAGAEIIYASSGSLYILSVTYNTTTSNIYYNSLISAVSGNVGANTSNGITLGADYANNNKTTGAIAYFSCYEGIHSATQRALIMNELSIKFGITII